MSERMTSIDLPGVFNSGYADYDRRTILAGSKGRAKRDAGRIAKTASHEIARAVLELQA